MSRFILKRILVSIPLILGITLLTFGAIQLAPGDFLDQLRLDPQTSPKVISYYEKAFHLDKGMFEQYFVWLSNIVRGEFGYSFAYKAKVIDIVKSRLFNTFILSFSSVIFTWLFVIPLGVIAALRRNKPTDKALSFMTYIGFSTPSFLLAFILLYGATYLNWLPLGGMRSANYDELSFFSRVFDIGRHLIIPTVVLSFGSICGLQRIMRANLLEVLGSTYILGARARGLSRMRILYVHTLKNALNPMITIFGYQFSGLLSGAALVEIVLGWPGLGVVMLDAVRQQDIYLVMGVTLSSGVLLIAGNLLADILLAYFDPRIRYEK